MNVSDCLRSIRPNGKRFLPSHTNVQTSQARQGCPEQGETGERRLYRVAERHRALEERVCSVVIAIRENFTVAWDYSTRANFEFNFPYRTKPTCHATACVACSSHSRFVARRFEASHSLPPRIRDKNDTFCPRAFVGDRSLKEEKKKEKRCKEESKTRLTRKLHPRPWTYINFYGSP